MLVGSVLATGKRTATSILEVKVPLPLFNRLRDIAIYAA